MRKRHVGLGTVIATLVAVAVPGQGVNAQAVLFAQDGRVASRASQDHVQPVAQSGSTVTVSFKNTKLLAALQHIAELSSAPMVFSSSQLPKTRVTYTASRVPVETALRGVLEGTALRIERIDGGGFKIVPGAVVVDGVIQGKIVHAETKQPVSGATVLLDDATSGVTTGSDGTFRITTSSGEHKITVRAVGFTRQVRTVTVGNEAVAVEITLEPSASVLNEVIVTGTVVATKRKAIPNPITVITAEEIERRGITRIEQFFRGEVPGLFVADPGSRRYVNYGDSTGMMVTADVYSRGVANLDSEANPIKTFVDGVEILDPIYLGTIDPQSIERIEIITGPQAATIYGSGAIGGVMQIFTKRGSGIAVPEVTANLRYGIMENNISNGRTPVHNHTVSLRGSNGPQFSYSGTASYNYSGQWMPGLFNRTAGVTLGMSTIQGPITVNGSISYLSGRNGLLEFGTSSVPMNRKRVETGEMAPSSSAGIDAKKEAATESQSFALNVDYRMGQQWQHHFTIGRNQINFENIPSKPLMATPADTLMSNSKTIGQRTTGGYNMTLVPGEIVRGITPTLTLGANGSWGERSAIRGSLITETSTSFVSPSVTRTLSNDSYGAFGSLQVGVLQQLFFTFGLRAEHSPTYGQEHKIDWTPTNGVTYVFEHDQLTVKLLGSYGRATRTPRWSQKQEVWDDNYGSVMPYLQQFESLDIRPERARGPQGGIEVYYGNRGSLTINRYKQNVVDLLQRIAVDTTLVTYISNGRTTWFPQYQWQNIAQIKQHGWETTGTLNVGVFNIKGTYSWNDSRVFDATGDFSYGVPFHPEMSFPGIPSHTGHLSVNAALRRTSVSVMSNWIGATPAYPYQRAIYYTAGPSYTRLLMYNIRRNSVSGVWHKPGYTKTDVVVVHRLSPSLSATMNIVNVGDSYGTEEGAFYQPAPGRQTTFGMSIKFP